MTFGRYMRKQVKWKCGKEKKTFFLEKDIWISLFYTFKTILKESNYKYVKCKNYFKIPNILMYYRKEDTEFL